MDIEVWRSGTVSDCGDVEYELDTSYPRLDSPFYRRLRKKYPRAFRRRTLNCSLSETSSVCSELPMSRTQQRAMLDAGDQSTGEGVRSEGRPPRHPGVDKGDELGVVGTPRRPRQRRGPYKGTGSQYSSTSSLYSQMVENCRNTAYRSEAMVSLRERLLQNQQCWDRLLNDDPPKRLRQRGGLGLADLSTADLSMSADGDVLRSADADKLEKLHELGQALERMMSGLGQEAATPAETFHGHAELDRTSPRCHTNGQPEMGRSSPRCHSNGQPELDRTSPRFHSNGQPELDRTSPRCHSNGQPELGRSSPRCHPNGQPELDRTSPRCHPNGPPEMGRSSPRCHANGQPEMDRSSPRCHANGQADLDGERKTMFPPRRRFASPDSHDSAVDMDNASLPSNHSSDNPHAGTSAAEGTLADRKETDDYGHVTDGRLRTSGPQRGEDEDDASSLHASRPSERPSRTRCRTPKLRSRGASPLLRSEPNSLNSSMNRDLTPRSTLLSPDQGTTTSTGGSTWSDQQKYSPDHIRHSKDSDADSGISQPVVKPMEPFSLTDDETNLVILRNSANLEDLQKHGSATAVGHGTAWKEHFPGSNVNLYSAARSRSCDKKREVTFEDEVRASHVDKRHRTLSQSALYSDDKTWISYADVVCGYGVPPGFDVEQYSDYLSTGVHELSGQSRKPAATRSKHASRRPPPASPRDKNVNSSHNGASPSSLAPPPRTKRKQQKVQQSGMDKSQERGDAWQSINHSDLQTPPSISEHELNTSLANTSLDEIDFDSMGQGKKKSKLPWRKNKGRFTPTKELEKVQNRIGSLSRSSSKTSLASLFMADNNGDSNAAAAVVTSDDSSANHKLAGSVPKQKRPMDKPPPIPKPKHLTKQHSSSTVQQLDCMVKAPDKKPSLPPKPQMKCEKPPVASSAETGSTAQKHDLETAPTAPGKNNSGQSTQQPSNLQHSEQGACPRPENKVSTRKNGNQYGGYEDVDGDEAPREFQQSENPYETVVVIHNGADEVMSAETNHSESQPSDAEVFNEVPVDVPPGCDQYASVDFSKKTHRRSEEEPEVEYINYDDDFHNEDEGPPLPDRGYHSNLEKTKELSSSRTSLSDSISSFKNSARKKFSKLRKALSLENVNKAGQDSDVKGRKASVDSISQSDTVEQNNNFKRSTSLKSITDAFGFVKKMRDKRSTGTGIQIGSLTPGQRRPPRPPSGSKRGAAIGNPETPQNFRPIGNVKAMNEDGTRIVELNKPPHGPFGFYIARASAKYNNGIIISRLSDALPNHFFAGLIAVGDEILEINGQEVHDMTLEDVFDIMATENRLILRTIPYASRIEI